MPVVTPMYAFGRTVVTLRMRQQRALAAKNKAATIKFTQEQYRVIAQRAERSQLSVSVWMRMVLMQAASRPANEEGFIRIKEPNGVVS